MLFACISRPRSEVAVDDAHSATIYLTLKLFFSTPAREFELGRIVDVGRVIRQIRRVRLRRRKSLLGTSSILHAGGAVELGVQFEELLHRILASALFQVAGVERAQPLDKLGREG